MAHVVPTPAIPTVPVEGGGEFPVRRIFCVGRNYADHAREMGGDPSREPPVFFTKPADAVTSAETVPYPTLTHDLHHEIELVVAIGQGGRDIAAADAQAHVFGYAVGLDLTRRDLQAAAKARGMPWDMAKGFDDSAPIAPITRADPAKPLEGGKIWLKINGDTRQSGDLADMIWSIPEVIAELSRYVALQPGDLIFTGTPAGVNRIEPGDELHGHVAGLSDLKLRIAG